eukprot:gnl/MRDRNA2_/MRDRNA2_67408_c0_seq1.p1 gnl/MRDRNA2_/MRDRNA2_67408_c0~~gnl/MRDRNA2_/MRDRNA2_67408_c0_seq1.p1  ORF type:complete len:608 (-),score=76.29 gnl/MRDRNA2_/MRDRNA2_67408_c0_seq1:82-1905(-)
MGGQASVPSNAKPSNARLRMARNSRSQHALLSCGGRLLCIGATSLVSPTARTMTTIQYALPSTVTDKIDDLQILDAMAASSRRAPARLPSTVTASPNDLSKLAQLTDSASVSSDLLHDQQWAQSHLFRSGPTIQEKPGQIETEWTSDRSKATLRGDLPIVLDKLIEKEVKRKGKGKGKVKRRRRRSVTKLGSRRSGPSVKQKGSKMQRDRSASSVSKGSKDIILSIFKSDRFRSDSRSDTTVIFKSDRSRRARMQRQLSDPSVNSVTREVRKVKSKRIAVSNLDFLSSNSPLLTADDEKRYGKLVQLSGKIQSVEENVLKATGRHPTVDEVADLLKIDAESLIRLKDKCEKARRRMIDSNVRLVISMAKKKRRKHTEQNIYDLVSAGIDGLRVAVDKFDPARGYKFSTYAYWWIRVSVDRYLREHRPVQVPVHYWEVLGKISKAKQIFKERFHYAPSDNQIGTILGIAPDKVRTILVACQEADSLDRVVFDGKGGRQGTRLEELVVVDDNSMNDSLEPTQTQEKSSARAELLLQGMFSSSLTTKETQILTMRYGLQGSKPLIFGKIAERLDMTRPQLRKAMDMIFLKLRSRDRQLINGLRQEEHMKP